MYTAHAVRSFINTKKKLPKTLRAELDRQVDLVCKDPSIGTHKAGDLRRVWVHKFNLLGRRYLLAYSIDEQAMIVTFLAIGGHENFYRDLKNYLKA
ncbi:MAG TPA: type II toxin-antitoxin system RelE/ParE family toxin [Candidatus Acetothermia bacterium]|nr:type II toxin-antitoxin system RelE/ParE family toxin [Candidatus Acetothermia bacterium]